MTAFASQDRSESAGDQAEDDMRYAADDESDTPTGRLNSDQAALEDCVRSSIGLPKR